MKPSALLLALFATVSVFAAEPATTTPPAPATPAPAAPTLTAAEANQQLAATLADIREQSIARAPENQKEGTAASVDPEVLELPKVTVKQQPRPRQRLGESTILGPKAFNDELAKKNLSALDRSVLNKFTLPSWLGGVSAADRAREDYNIAQKQQFMSDVLTISKAVEQTDPAAAKALRDAAAKP